MHTEDSAMEAAFAHARSRGHRWVLGPGVLSGPIAVAW